MAIYFHTGVLGAGKSYGATYMIARDYCIKKDGHYVLKDGILLISNIRGLKLSHINLDDLIEQIPGDDFRSKIISFFDFDFQEFFLKDQYKDFQVLYFIDEAADYFSPEFLTGRDVECVKKFFRRCRHLGCDIFIIAQDKSQVHSSIVRLSEYECRAMPRVLSFGPFHYQYRVGRAKIKSRFFPKKKDIFSLYTSQDKKETSKISNPFIPVFLILGLLFCFLLWKASNLYGPKEKKSEVSAVSESLPAGSAVPAPVSSASVPKVDKKSDSEKKKIETVEKRIRLAEYWVGDVVYLFDRETSDFYRFDQFPKKVEVFLDPVSSKHRFYAMYDIPVEKDYGQPRTDDSFTNKYIGGVINDGQGDPI
ncbi:MAG: zonular occludens toxin domain-containing protein [Desulfococcaceae bacterium]